MSAVGVRRYARAYALRQLRGGLGLRVGTVCTACTSSMLNCPCCCTLLCFCSVSGVPALPGSSNASRTSALSACFIAVFNLRFISRLDSFLPLSEIKLSRSISITLSSALNVISASRAARSSIISCALFVRGWKIKRHHQPRRNGVSSSARASISAIFLR